MRKLLLCTLIAVVFMSACQSHKYNIYPQTLIVAETNEETDVVTLVDSVGHIWEFVGIEDWIIGDMCSCIMSDNGTENIDDDIIVNTKYSGNVGRD